MDHKFETCLCIYEAKYFIHVNKNGKLNKKQLEAVDDFLRHNYFDLNISNWEMICATWDNSNGVHTQYKGMKQPDYSKTKESIH